MVSLTSPRTSDILHSKVIIDVVILNLVITILVNIALTSCGTAAERRLSHS